VHYVLGVSVSGCGILCFVVVVVVVCFDICYFVSRAVLFRVGLVGVVGLLRGLIGL